MKKLKIAQVAPLWFPIPPKKYGGIEWIVYNLCERLAKLGHKVTLFASGDSKPPKGGKISFCLSKILDKRRHLLAGQYL